MQVVPGRTGGCRESLALPLLDGGGPPRAGNPWQCQRSVALVPEQRVEERCGMACPPGGLLLVDSVSSRSAFHEHGAVAHATRNLLHGNVHEFALVEFDDGELSLDAVDDHRVLLSVAARGVLSRYQLSDSMIPACWHPKTQHTHRPQAGTTRGGTGPGSSAQMAFFVFVQRRHRVDATISLLYWLGWMHRIDTGRRWRPRGMRVRIPRYASNRMCMFLTSI